MSIYLYTLRYQEDSKCQKDGQKRSRRQLEDVKITYMWSDSFFLNVILVFVDFDDESLAPRLRGHLVAGHTGLDGRVGPGDAHLLHVNLQLASLNHILKIKKS